MFRETAIIKVDHFRILTIYAVDIPDISKNQAKASYKSDEVR